MPREEADFWSAQTLFTANELDALLPAGSTASDRGSAPVLTAAQSMAAAWALMNERSPQFLADAAEYNASLPEYTWEDEDALQDLRDRVRHPHFWHRDPDDHSDYDDRDYEHRFMAGRVDNAPQPSPQPESSNSESEELTEVQSAEIGNTPVRESYDSLNETTISPLPSDDIITQSVVMTGVRDADLVTIRVDRYNNVYTQQTTLPADHYLNPAFRGEHEAALRTALSDWEVEQDEMLLNLDTINDPTPSNINEESIRSWADPSPTVGMIPWDRRGLPDVEPHLLPGVAFHQRLASLGPESDNEDALPGFRVQFLAARTNARPHGNQRLPETVGLLDQPRRPRGSTACITVLLNINGTEAYVLIDTGSTTNSVTPEFANATGAPQIKLLEQLLLQLGCKGSHSKINYGTRVPVDFGGVKGYVYFDIVNLDCYDCVLGTPFLTRHSVVIDFGKRELCFPNGNIVSALPIIEEAALIVRRSAIRRDLHRPSRPEAQIV
ncbi:hypothetical protein B0H11DRAFT_2264477 [Mycena galericulata]|nr:hypothetical protein B0H11DRAFT_2264477 [Mycena galericulata]